MYLDMQSDEEDNPDQNDGGGDNSNYDDKENNDFSFDETIVKVEPAY